MSSGQKILIIDDEMQIRRALRLSLEAHGYEVVDAITAHEGITLVASVRPDLVILDLGLPDMDGLDAIKKIREWSQIPVIVLTVKNSEQDKIDLLDAGANDYVTKPFGMGELLARMRAVLRLSLPEASDGIVQTGDLAIDFSKRIVMKRNKEIKMTPTEYSLLSYVARNMGKVITHNQIIKELWGPNATPDSSYLRVYVLQLRRKIEDDPSNPRYLITEPGIGYRLMSD
jgi:two-component system, OmpR family, KDP operon response regulator KdpE